MLTYTSVVEANICIFKEGVATTSHCRGVAQMAQMYAGRLCKYVLAYTYKNISSGRQTVYLSANLPTVRLTIPELSWYYLGVTKRMHPFFFSLIP